MTAALAAPAPEREVVHATLAACAIARLALPLVPADEPRPRRAIEAAEAWARGEGESHAAVAAADEAERAAHHALDAPAEPTGAAACAAAWCAARLAGRRRVDPVIDTERAISHVADNWRGPELHALLVNEMRICADAILAAHALPSRPTPLVAFLRAPSRESALVALDWLREGRGTAAPPVWALAWLYAHVPGVAP